MSNLDGSSHSVLSTFSGRAPFAMAMDHKHNSTSLYWTDRLTQAIYHTVVDGNDSATTTYYTTSLVPYGMALYEADRTGG